ncbi:toxin co-regulated pilus biosynthesis Q family protein [Cupriavidus basilensis]|uniref:toxin co-regulated pilus biosynthesis Q family protein n=1 Tax=Cupriavidus basilensis TaxID=68895 RepID=UPI0007514235|nr:toxin co-regulated pilus biosynthesis Q family protein [Cupriavidus basilensis]
MSQYSRHPRLGRILATVGVIAASACANAAVVASPFGVEPVGSFEPTKPLSGSGWQPLASVTKRSVPAPAVSVPVAPTVVAPSTVPVAAVSLIDSKSDIVPAAVPGPIATVPSEPAAPTSWVVSPGDGTFRQVIEGWAPRAGWTLAPWELDSDVPVEGADSFDGDFKAAVRHLLASTELTDFALQPCFYSNKRVRVVKATTKCDPSQ